MKHILALTLLTIVMSVPALAADRDDGRGAAIRPMEIARHEERPGDRGEHRGWDRDEHRDHDGWRDARENEWREHEWREHEWHEHERPHLVTWRECRPSLFFGVVCYTRTAWR